MLGPPKPRRLDEPIAVSLEDLVPAGPLLPPPGGEARSRASSATGRGSSTPSAADPSIDPVVFFKLQLVMFFEGIRSERQLIETASLNLAHRWYLGYALDEALPDHSSLTRIRQRLGRRRLPALLRAGRRSVPGGGAGLGPGAVLRRHEGRGQRRHPDSLVPRFYYEATTHVADLFADEADGDEHRKPTPTLACRTSCRCRSSPTESVAQPSVIRRGDLLEERRLDPNRPSHRGYRRTSDFRVSPTDPDASPMWDWRHDPPRLPRPLRRRRRASGASSWPPW